MLINPRLLIDPSLIIIIIHFVQFVQFLLIKPPHLVDPSLINLHFIKFLQINLPLILIFELNQLSHHSLIPIFFIGEVNKYNHSRNVIRIHHQVHF